MALTKSIPARSRDEVVITCEDLGRGKGVGGKDLRRSEAKHWRLVSAVMGNLDSQFGLVRIP